MSIAIVASRDLMLDYRIQSTVESLVTAAAKTGGSICIRGAEDGYPASPVEALAQMYAFDLGVQAVMHRPFTGTGRSGVYDRDYELISHAERVYAFFSEGKAMEGGRGHVVHAAIVKNVPVVAYEVGEDVTLIGELDADVPAW